MNYEFLPLGILALGGIILTAGDILMKKWILSSQSIFYVIGVVVWLFGLLFLAQSFKYKNIASASTIFVIFNITTLALVSWLYFKEKLSPLELAGLILGITAIVLLEIGDKQ